MRLLIFSVLLLTIAASAQNTSPASTSFPGTYAQLKPQQKKLIDDWYAEYDRLMHLNDPPTDYDTLSLSTRTTFEAVTHALMTTNLTDKSGKSMGDALNLVQAIETINGKVPKARGDLQFRVYVILKPTALQTLKDSKEFFRDRDNTVYHHGYPLNWRQDGGAPSIQISMAPDGRHADIDVDYRSSQFPAALFNGHLSAANSDVRAGNNTQRHQQRWQGLADWWRNLFGLDLKEPPDAEKVAEQTGDVPPIPRKGSGRLDEAVFDFLNSWLLEGKPEFSASYLSPRAYSCLEEYGPQSGNEISAAAAPYLAARDLAAISKALGKPAKLQDAVASFPLDDTRLKKMKQQYANLFTLYAVPNGVAPEFECDEKRAMKDFEDARLTGVKRRYNSYFASALRLEQPHESGQIITILWTKEGNYWKVVSWDMEPENSKPRGPDTRIAAAELPEPTVKGDPALVQASHQFLREWLINRNYVAATAYFSPKSYSCINAVLSADQPKPTSPSQYLNYMQTAMQTVAEDVERVQHLPDVIEPAEAEHQGLKLVTQPHEKTYTLVAVPDTLAPVLTCGQESREHPFDFSDGANLKYGAYYGQLFAIRTPGDHPASLAFLWSKESGKWKIVSYQMLTP